mmetsp:Transcript_100377/g.183131  ORF Transcript_100377/g.183131 Transcript_100377/m.183131 type:complete len:1397 (-) Transcript_100377:167-4357(-)
MLRADSRLEEDRRALQEVRQRLFARWPAGEDDPLATSSSNSAASVCVESPSGTASAVGGKATHAAAAAWSPQCEPSPASHSSPATPEAIAARFQQRQAVQNLGRYFVDAAGNFSSGRSAEISPAPASPQSPADEHRDESGEALIRRRLFAQHPSRSPLDTTSSFSEGVGAGATSSNEESPPDAGAQQRELPLSPPATSSPSLPLTFGVATDFRSGMADSDSATSSELSMLGRRRARWHAAVSPPPALPSGPPSVSSASPPAAGDTSSYTSMFCLAGDALWETTDHSTSAGVADTQAHMDKDVHADITPPRREGTGSTAAGSGSANTTGCSSGTAARPGLSPPSAGSSASPKRQEADATLPSVAEEEQPPPHSWSSPAEPSPSRELPFTPIAGEGQSITEDDDGATTFADSTMSTPRPAAPSEAASARSQTSQHEEMPEEQPTASVDQGASTSVELEGPGASESSQAEAPATAASRDSKTSCEFHIEESDLVHDFERLNESLRHHGFRTVPHWLEAVPSLSSGRSRLVADAQSLWVLCGDVLTAYEERGRRLRDALLAERAEQRQTRDARIKSLLQDNARLENEVKKLRATVAMPTAGDGEMAAARTAGVAPQPASARASERELAEMTLRVKAAEATVRQREREFERLRLRLDQAVAEAARRQEREREALSRPLRRKAASRDDPLLAVAVAHQARADNLQAEVASLTKSAHVLSFQLDSAEGRCRKLEAQQQFQTSAGEQAAPQNVGQSAEAASALDGLREDATHERELRVQASEQLCAQQIQHAEEVRSLTARLKMAEARAEELEDERRVASRQPSTSELRWQREALRLRDEVAEARRAWRSSDPRTLMRRDKEIRSLGLDPRALEENAKKGDLVSLLLEICRLLKVGDLSDIIPSVSGFGEMSARLLEFRKFANDVREVVKDFVSTSDAAPPEPSELLQCLRLLRSELLQRRGADAAGADTAAAEPAAEPAEKRTAKREASTSELRWQREALRLRDALAEAKRAWRSAASVDPRALIRRDRELRNLGMDPRALEQNAQKGDLISLLLDVCRLLKVGNLSQIIPMISTFSETSAALAELQSCILQEAGGGGKLFQESPGTLQRLRSDLHAELLKCHGASEGSESPAEATQADSAAESHQCRSRAQADAEWFALAAKLQLPAGTPPSDCLQRVTELCFGEDVLDGLMAQLRCKSMHELPQKADRLLRLCDERLAQQRIVEALQKLLRVGSVEEVLPALKEVLDVGALRRRTAATAAAAAAVSDAADREQLEELAGGEEGSEAVLDGEAVLGAEAQSSLDRTAPPASPLPPRRSGPAPSSLAAAQRRPPAGPGDAPSRARRLNAGVGGNAGHAAPGSRERSRAGSSDRAAAGAGQANAPGGSQHRAARARSSSQGPRR